MTKFKTIGTWVFIVLAGLGFLAGGGAKLAGVDMVHQSFATLGLPAWFGYFIGACEVLGGIALFIRPLASFSAMGLSIIMVGATYYHLIYDPKTTIAAVLLLVFSLLIALSRFPDNLFKQGWGKAKASE